MFQNGAAFDNEEILDREMHVVAAIEEWNRGLPQLALSKKYERLGESPSSFFKGTNHLFWADFSGDERLAKFGTEDTRTWICGDCQVDSFNASGSDSEGPMYGLSDFDEAVIADYQYDVWRMAISIVLSARASGGACASEDVQQAAVKAFALRYLKAVVGYRQTDRGDDRRERLSILLAYTAGNMKGRLVRFMGVVEREYSRKRFLKNWCTEEKSKVEFTSIPGALQACPQYEKDTITVAFAYYAEHAQGAGQPGFGMNVKDVARRVYSGIADCGVPRYYVLTEAADGELHVLDVKLQQRPTAYHFMRPEERAQYRQLYDHDAARHCQACRTLSSSQDPYNGWIELQEDVHPSAAGMYSVRDLSPYEEWYPVFAGSDTKARLKSFTLTNQEGLVELAEDWARILGTQHAHAACQLDPESITDQRPTFSREIAALAKSDRGGFEELVWSIARDYAQQVTADWLAFKRHLL
eukprot:jgi/Mesen1/3077/ME000183S02135